MPRRNNKPATPLLVVHTLAFFGYVSCLFQWLWIFILYLPRLVENQLISTLFLPMDAPQPAPSTVSSGELPLGLTIAAVVTTVIILAITVLVLIRLPAAVVRGSKRAIDTSADKLIPIITRQANIPAKKHRKLSITLRILIKLSLCLLPTLFLALVPFVPPLIDGTIAIITGGFFATWTLIWFGLEYLMAYLLKIPIGKVA